MGGGGESTEAAFTGLLPYLKGHSVTNLEELRFRIANPTASLYNNRTQLLAAVEFACLDALGQKLGVPVFDLLGGRSRDTVRFVSYLFFRYPGEAGGEVRTVDQLVDYAAAPRREYGFRTHKLKGGVFPPAHELECYRALSETFPDDMFRFDSQFGVEHGTGHLVREPDRAHCDMKVSGNAQSATGRCGCSNDSLRPNCGFVHHRWLPMWPSHETESTVSKAQIPAAARVFVWLLAHRPSAQCYAGLLITDTPGITSLPQQLLTIENP